MNESTKTKRRWIDRIKQHPVISTVASLIGAVVMVASLISAVDVITTKGPDLVTSDTVQQPVITQEDVARTNEDVSVDINVLDNDLNTGTWDDIAISVDRTNTKGTVTIGPSGRIRYSPPQDFSGRDQFSYTATTNDGKTSTAPVIVEVAPVNDVPITNLDSIVINYPQDRIKIVDLVGTAYEPEGQSIRLASFNIRDTTQQPRTVFQMAEGAAYFIGSFEPEQMDRAKGAIMLEIYEWVDQIAKNGHIKSFSKILDYQLQDDSGGIADYSLKIQVEIANITTIIFECQPPGRGYPERINFQLLLNGEAIKEIPIHKEHVEEWGFLGFDRDILFTEIEDNAEVIATWSKGYIFTTCDGTAWLNTTEKLKWLSLALSGSDIKSKATGRISIKNEFINPVNIIPKEIEAFKNSP